MLNNALVTALASPKVGRSPPPQEVKDGCFIHYAYLI